jgi:hypothetical protein
MTRWCAALVTLLLVPVAVEARGDAWEVDIHVGRTFIDALGEGMAYRPPGRGLPVRDTRVHLTVTIVAHARTSR